LEGRSFTRCDATVHRDNVRLAVVDANAPSSLRALAELEKPTMRQRLHRIALWSTGADAAAEDLVADALIRVLDPDDVPWIPEKSTFLTHMSFVMRQVWDRVMRKAGAQREVLDAGLTHDEAPPSEAPSVDDELDHHRANAIRRSLLDDVVAAIEGETPLVRRICELGAQGIEEPAEQARMLDCPVQAIYDALAVLKRHARAALDEWGRAERRRMMSARAVAAKKEAAP
jgi:DNA-directed RNA polymerase specialized sigma24 family protein